MRITRHHELEVFQKDKWLYAEYAAILGMIVRACFQNGRDRSPQRAGVRNENADAHEMDDNRAIAHHSLSILTDRSEIGPCLSGIFRQALKMITNPDSWTLPHPIK